MSAGRDYLAHRKSVLLKASARKHVYIGLDFGTTFAKVAYEIAPTTDHLKRSVRFGNNDESPFIPTVLYFHSGNSTLSFRRKGTDDESVVRFFKYSMVVDGLEKNVELNRCSESLSTVPERLCSAFYLACLITIVRTRICKVANVTNVSDVDWHINMGIPVGKTVGNNPQVKPVYDEVLQVAWAWANSSYGGRDTVSIAAFDEFYKRNKTARNPDLQTVPELYAEVLMYQQDNNIPEGFYAVIDIGGGTVDMAVFLKRIQKGEGAKVYCVAHEVSSEGMESIVSRVSDKLNQELMERIRQCMLNERVQFDRLGGINISDLKVSMPSRRLIASIKDFQRSYGTCMMKAKDNKFQEMQKAARTGSSLRYFMMGGGKDVHFYNSLIEDMIRQHSRFLKTLAHAQRADIRDYMRSSANLECKDDDRLVISQMLAQPFDNIPQLDGMPWDFVAAKPTVVSNSHQTYSNKLEDIQREIYGDD